MLAGGEPEGDAAAKAVPDDDQLAGPRHAACAGVESVGIGREPGLARDAGIAAIFAIFGGDHAIAIGDQRGEPLHRSHRTRRVAVEDEQGRLAGARGDLDTFERQAVGGPHRHDRCGGG